MAATYWETEEGTGYWELEEGTGYWELEESDGVVAASSNADPNPRRRAAALGLIKPPKPSRPARRSR